MQVVVELLWEENFTIQSNALSNNKTHLVSRELLHSLHGTTSWILEDVKTNPR